MLVWICDSSIKCFGNAHICFCQHYVLHFRYTIEFWSSSLVCDALLNNLSCLWHAYFIRSLSIDATILYYIVFQYCLFVTECIDVSSREMGIPKAKNCFAPFHVIFIFVTHACCQYACVFTLQILYICWGSHLCCLWYIIFAVLFLLVICVVYDANKKEEVNCKTSKRAQKQKQKQPKMNRISEDGWLSVFSRVLCSYIYSINTLTHKQTVSPKYISTPTTQIHDLCFFGFKLFSTTLMRPFWLNVRVCMRTRWCTRTLTAYFIYS